ncbi:unnamed protein product [Strongylus vulgaris]|uniref:Tyrosine-protein phosphatase domain-containing protein n=1 Tax=Strongylus vulgaris TaxID=40348 RepID=A0A3P7JH94_STRVU|nr:unnamed protein product [Strongylus vulgaris]
MDSSKLGRMPKFRSSTATAIPMAIVAAPEEDGTQVECKLWKQMHKSSQSMGAAGFKEAFKLFCDRTLKVSVYEFGGKTRVNLETLQVGVQELTEEFLKLKMKTQAIEVYCIDATRVILTWPAGFCDYIHANWVDGVERKKKFICTQGPIDKTVDDFWRMIWQEKCKSIIMLCNVMERGKQKCEQYWPLTPNEPMRLRSGLTLRFVSMDAVEKSVKLTKILLTTSSGAQHMVEHFHWTDWPDRGVPNTTTLAIFRMLCRVNRLIPCVVHCSAGIGRTGTVVGIDMLYRKLERGDKDVSGPPIYERTIFKLFQASLLQVVEDLREMRHGAVQMDAQFLYMHRILLVVAENLNIITPEETQKFNQDYDNFLKKCGFL